MTEQVYLWGAGIVLTAVSTAGTWAAKKIIAHDKDIAVMKETLDTIERSQARMEDTQNEMFRYLRRNSRDYHAG